jgi:hypothetical protein
MVDNDSVPARDLEWEDITENKLLKTFGRN